MSWSFQSLLVNSFHFRCWPLHHPHHCFGHIPSHLRLTSVRPYTVKTSYDIQIQRQCVLLTKCIVQTSRVSFPPCLWSIEICFSTYSLLHLCPPRKKKLRNELRIQDRQDQLRQSQGFRSSCLTDVHVAIRVAKVTLLIKLLNINEKQA